jgi:hypothetical protein
MYLYALQPHHVSLSLSLKQKWKKTDWMISRWMNEWMDIFHHFLPFSISLLLIPNVQHGGIFYHFPHHPFLSGMCNMAAFFTIYQQPHRLSLSKSKSGKRIDWMNAGWMDGWIFLIFFYHFPHHHFNPECATCPHFLPFSSSPLFIWNVQHGGIFYHLPATSPSLSLSPEAKMAKKMDWMIAGWMDGYFPSLFTIFLITPFYPECATWLHFLPFSSSCLLIRNVQHGGTFYHFHHHSF